MNKETTLTAYRALCDQHLELKVAVYKLNAAMGHRNATLQSTQDMLVVIAEATRKLNAVRAVISGESE